MKPEDKYLFVNGLRLHYLDWGQDGKQAMLLLHGFTTLAHAWDMFAPAFRDRYHILAMDQRGHGDSQWADDASYTTEDHLVDIAGFVDALKLDKFVLVGHSMGGKTVMFLAEAFPERVDSLIVIDIAPTTCHPDDHSSQARTHTEIVKGMLSVDFSQVHKREDVDKQLARTIHSPRIRRFLMKNVTRSREGDYQWKLNAAAIGKELSSIFEGIDLSKYSPGTGITGFPVLFIRGEHSDYITDDCIPDIKKIFPMAEIATIPQAGHWLHVEQPDLLVKTIRYFL